MVKLLIINFILCTLGHSEINAWGENNHCLSRAIGLDKWTR